ncbi:hypothetical protein [[Phormidium] sp. ETS-05]|nr:hypothetical protein [[Phormidium] sp. ETS-05]
MQYRDPRIVWSSLSPCGREMLPDTADRLLRQVSFWGQLQE